ncbi:MAG: hypothetical protein Q4G69_12015, partial [Planctomycetia bacterium]|nr:hypothetical protein [Planctomycetia bacterium]
FVNLSRSGHSSIVRICNIFAKEFESTYGNDKEDTMRTMGTLGTKGPTPFTSRQGPLCPHRPLISGDLH